MQHYYIKAVGHERSGPLDKITSIQFEEVSDKDKIIASVEFKGKIVGVFLLWKSDLEEVVKWMNRKDGISAV